MNTSELDYEIRINFSHSSDRIWICNFINKFRNFFRYKGKKVAVSGNVLKFILTKEDNIQDYIEIIKNLLKESKEIYNNKNNTENTGRIQRKFRQFKLIKM